MTEIGFEHAKLIIIRQSVKCASRTRGNEGQWKDENENSFVPRCLAVPRAIIKGNNGMTFVAHTIPLGEN